MKVYIVVECGYSGFDMGCESWSERDVFKGVFLTREKAISEAERIIQKEFDDEVSLFHRGDSEKECIKTVRSVEAPTPTGYEDHLNTNILIKRFEFRNRMGNRGFFQVQVYEKEAI